MYQKPTLNRVGDAQEVILGLVVTGSDLDGTYVPGGTEYADDETGVMALSWS